MKWPTILTSMMVICCLCPGESPAVEKSTQGRPGDAANIKVIRWADAIQAIRAQPGYAETIKTLTAQAHEEVKLGLFRRAHTLADVGKNRTWLDGRSKVLEDEIRETFALAMSDFGACNSLANTLPVVATAARLTGDKALRSHVIAQLREMSTWSPLQRPGWTLYAPGNRLPKDGKDGNWLATGCGVRAIVTTLEIMGDEVDGELRGALAALLAKEIVSVLDDWKTKRTWFVRTNNAVTNQWVLPTEGLVRACLYLGREKHRDAYEFGVKNLLQALSSHGQEGEFEEGIGYAQFTLTSLFHTARAMAVAGDRRAIDHPFLARYPTWAVHHIQPGRLTVNCFDAGNAAIPRNHVGWRSMLSLMVYAGASKAANWALWEQFDGPTDDLNGLMACVLSKRIKRAPPSLFKAYERAAMVVWRDSWADNANGVWVRGGHRLDQHDHQDRGHVNYIANGKPMLIEAGTPSYSNPDMSVHYASGAGHNVLQIGIFFPERPYPPQTTPKYAGWQRIDCIAPIAVNRLDRDGGSVIVDGRRCYAETRRWVRRVDWTGAELSVTDDVGLSENTAEVILFRWHLGTNDPVEIRGDGNAFTVTWPDAKMTLEADQPIRVKQYPAPDSTLTGSQDHQHVCVQVNSWSAVSNLKMTMMLRPTPPADR